MDLTRTGDTTGELTVWLQVLQTAPKELTRQDSVVFAAGNATAQHTITTESDDASLGNYTVTVYVLNPVTIDEPSTYLSGYPSSATTTVRDTRVPAVNLGAGNLRVIEGEAITLTLSRLGTGRPLTVNLDITETGQFTTGTLPTTVTFGRLDSVANATITTEDDSVVEDVGKLTVTVQDGTDYRAGWPNTHTFEIHDNDGVKPLVSVSGDQDWVNEGDPVSFTVTHNGSTTSSLEARLKLTRIRYRVTADDLNDPTRGITTPPNHIHFGVEEITLTIPAGTNTLTVTRPTTDDNLPHGNSTYHALVLNDPDDEYVAPFSQSDKVWVQDNDIPTVTGLDTLSEHYGGPNPVLLPFTRTGDTSGLLELVSNTEQISYRPRPLRDLEKNYYNVKRGGFSPGASSGVQIGTFRPKALGDGGSMEILPYHCPDDPEACGYYPQYQLGTPATITFRVYSNTMGVRVAADQTTVEEGTAATFTLHRHGGKSDSLTRPLHVMVQVTQDGDYISGAAPQTVTFAGGEATATLTLPTLDDAIDEADGSITVEILRAPVDVQGPTEMVDDQYGYRHYDYPGSRWEDYTVTTGVTDNELPAISVEDASAYENGGTIEFSVSLERPNTENAASVDWATSDDGSTAAATSGVDYTAASGTLNFAIGETEKTVTVTLLDDELDEDERPRGAPVLLG